MKGLPPDPLQSGGIQGFAKRFRSGQTASEAVTSAYLERIEALDPRLGAYEHVARESALAQARALDGLLAAGTDLGPLMGVPVAVKDLFAVEGMPTTAGSNLDVTGLVGGEGRFVGMLRRAGCVILGKTKTVEFAMGGTGINLVRGTPWNPWDARVHRVPGGSSSGSAVAAAAGLCAFAIGSDTGGSVRLPAFSGIFALKTTKGRWPTDGVASLSRTLDTIGPITKSASDAAVVFGVLCGVPTPAAAEPRGLRLGRPTTLFFDDLDRDVKRCVDAALTALAAAGVEIVDCELSETAEHMESVQHLIAAEFITTFGRERFEASRADMDPDVRDRLQPGLDLTADAYIRLLWRHREHCQNAPHWMEGLDGWLAPTNPTVAMALADLEEPAGSGRYRDRLGRNTNPANFMGLCATSTPIQQLGSALPVGLQVMCRADEESRALSIALWFEELFGLPPQPDLREFL